MRDWIERRTCNKVEVPGIHPGPLHVPSRLRQTIQKIVSLWVQSRQMDVCITYLCHPTWSVRIEWLQDKTQDLRCVSSEKDSKTIKAPSTYIIEVWIEPHCREICRGKVYFGRYIGVVQREKDVKFKASILIGSTIRSNNHGLQNIWPIFIDPYCVRKTHHWKNERVGERYDERTLHIKNTSSLKDFSKLQLTKDSTVPLHGKVSRQTRNLTWYT